MPKTYRETIEPTETIKNFGVGQGFDLEGDFAVKKIELEDQILVETHPLIKSVVEVYITGEWTEGGNTAELRLTIPIEYYAGNEDEVINAIENQIFASLDQHGDGLDRLENIQIEEIVFPEEGEVEFDIEEKPVFERQIIGDIITTTERVPNFIEQTTRTIGRGFRGTVNAIGKGIGFVGGFLKGISDFLGRF